ncbi:copper chaperone CopZ [Paenisporosarcina sp. OV554]|jgi:copper chaperone|uniref:copper chaperone CopZ n=1 Tax=Paenisporosarcina sp. OV554 TaxID=2135694 RepID=UPI000D388669|nr:copper chaperone CopZ [Paenisporosarcina sp. OV554]PUB10620.1 copper chaperone [Paenisporosarcina sp. OV554]
MTNQVTLQVQGMSCGHCVKSIENSVGAIEGVEKVNVQLNDGTVDVEFNNKVDVQKITDTIEDQGYTVGA